MTIILSPEETARWEEGGWLSLEIQETVLEDIERQHITEPVVMTLANGTVAFGVTGGEVR